MDVFDITRALVDIESITNNEERAGNYLYDCLSALAVRFDSRVERIEVEPRRFNVFAQWGQPVFYIYMERFRNLGGKRRGRRREPAAEAVLQS